MIRIARYRTARSHSIQTSSRH